ncbi:MAG: sigma-54-dependent Fis family transcriptional regulator [Planctomycetaceae bacterium]|nr:sigma-54-dependent Fis family transcriptional regulator [Planctomycetaceae bacterium]
MPTLLIVDDESSVRFLLAKHLGTDEIDVITAETANEGIALVEQHRPDAVILDVRLPDMSGLDAFNEMRARDVHLPVIIITAHATTEMAIEAMKRGAFEYLLKPLDLNELREKVHAAFDVSRLSRVPTVFDQTGTDDEIEGDRIIGLSPAMQQVYKDIGRVATQDVNVLIQGESGTGKELVARAIYQHSQRTEKPFLAINCAAIPESLLESELFGHEKGAFTGADRRRIGKFEQADKGTLFLDEIGDMTLMTQAKILRLLQDGRFERIGGNQTIETNVRVVAATNHDLQQRIQEGKFREDLYFRLSVFTIHLPPLRQRMDDLPLLARHFAKLFGKQLKKPVGSIAPEAFECMKAYAWPGNVRELQSAIKYAIVQMTSDVLLRPCLPEGLCGQSVLKSSGADSTPTGTIDIEGMFEHLADSKHEDIYYEIQNVVDRILLATALRRVDGNQVAASRLLGISRTTLRSKLESLGMLPEN